MTTATRSAEPFLTLLLSLSISLLAYFLTSSLVPFLSNDLVSKGLKGRDMLKVGFSSKKDDTASSEGENDEDEPGKKWLPEATGVIGASVYILLLSLFAPLPYLSSLLPSQSPHSTIPIPSYSTKPIGEGSFEGSLQFPHHSFSTYLATLLSLLMATFLGFCDDVFDIRWRFKLPIPLIASVPLLVTYAAGHGVTDVVIPDILGLRQLFGIVSTNGLLHLGWIYYLYMSLLSIFTTNSINILAGINGVEVSQALIISLSLILNDLLYLTLTPSSILQLLPASLQTDKLDGLSWSIGMANGSKELEDRHLFSLYFMLPLVGVCLGLLEHNWYPARSFIGDTFCYFSGMSFAVTSILSHYSKTLLLFFIPQIFNFLYSTPQLFGLVPCPRHRLPSLNRESGKLDVSWTVIKPVRERSAREKLGVLILRVAEKFGLVRLEREGGEVRRSTNLTILNLVLIRRGEMREDRLCKELIAIQVLGSAVGFAVRYGMGSWIYGMGGERR